MMPYVAESGWRGRWVSLARSPMPLLSAIELVSPRLEQSALGCWGQRVLTCPLVLVLADHVLMATLRWAFAYAAAEVAPSYTALSFWQRSARTFARGLRMCEAGLSALTFPSLG